MLAKAPLLHFRVRAGAASGETPKQRGEWRESAREKFGRIVTEELARRAKVDARKVRIRSPLVLKMGSASPTGFVIDVSPRRCLC